MEVGGPGLPELTPQCLGNIFGHLSSRDAACACCVQKLWRDLIVSDEQLWQRHLAEELGVTSKQGSNGHTKPTHWAAYTSWRVDFGRDYWPYLGRAIRAWSQIKTWLASNMPEILTTLRPGLSEAEVSAVESELGFELPPALKVLYRLQDGQSLAYDDAEERRVRRRYRQTAAAAGAAAGGASGSGAGAPGPGGGGQGEEEEDDDGGGDGEEEAEGGDEARLASVFRGLFGGYAVYDHRVVSRMPPLRRAVLWREELLHSAAKSSARVQDMLARQSGREAGAARWRAECEKREGVARQAGLEPRASLDALLPFSCSYNLEDKLVVADAVGGGLAVAKMRPGGWDLRPAVPMADTRDGVLRWFEEYARRLETGCYQPWVLDEERSAQTRIISLFPRTQPALSEAVTRGVRVRASVVFVPEAAVQGRHLFAYAIRFSMDPGAPLSRCQLTHRHWVIRDENGGVLDTVHGEGVIGLYPILEPGNPEFVYCSCTHQVATRGSMEGEFEFVGGTMERPEGGSFNVVCPAFRLDVPEFIF